jgi:hypothetical protein
MGLVGEPFGHVQPANPVKPKLEAALCFGLALISLEKPFGYFRVFSLKEFIGPTAWRTSLFCGSLMENSDLLTLQKRIAYNSPRGELWFQTFAFEVLDHTKTDPRNKFQ